MLGPSGPLRLCRRQQKQQSFALSSNGPSTRPPQGHTLADLPVGIVLRVKGPPAINRFSVSRPRLQNSPRFPQAASTSPRRKRSINPDLLSLSLGYLLSKPRSSASRERCTNIWFNKTVPRSLPSLYPQIGLHSSASPTHPALLDIRPDLRSKADPVAAPPHASLRASLLLAGASDESIADIGFLLPIPPPWPQVLFSFRQLVIVPVTSRRQEDTTNSRPPQHHQTTGTRSGETYLFRHSTSPGHIHGVTSNFTFDRLSFGINTFNDRSHLGHIPTIYHSR
jgi:hypothetical protein